MLLLFLFNDNTCELPYSNTDALIYLKSPLKDLTYSSTRKVGRILQKSVSQV